MQYSEEKGLQPYGTIYRFTQEEINNLVNGYITEKTGLSLDVKVGCLDEDFDVYIRWNLDDVEDIETAFTDEQWDKITDIGLSPNEDFMNRDYLFAGIFGTTFIAYYYQPQKDEQEEYYELTLINETYLGE